MSEEATVRNGLSGGISPSDYSAPIINLEKINIHQVAEKIADVSTVNGDDTLAVLEALFQVVPQERTQSQDTLKQLVKIGEVINSESQKNLKAALETATRGICELIKADCAIIYPYALEHDGIYDVENVVSYGTRKKIVPERKRREKGLSTIIRNIGELIVHDVQEGILDDPQIGYVDKQELIERIQSAHFIEAEAVQAFFGISLTTIPALGEKSIEAGLLYVDFREPHHFSVQELDILHLFAHQIAGVIQNAYAFEAVRKERQERIRAIREIGTSITTHTDKGDVLQKLLQTTLSLMKDGSVGEILLHEYDELITEVSDGTVENKYSVLKIEQGIVGRVASLKKSVIVNDVTTDPDYLRGLANTQSELAVPLLKAGELIGVLNVEHPDLDAFNHNDVELLEAIASQVVLALGIADEQFRLTQIIEGSSMATFVINKQHVVTHWNEACEFLTGFSAKDVIGTKDAWRAFYSTPRSVLANLIVEDDYKEIEALYTGKYQESYLPGAYEAQDFFSGMGENGKWLSFTAAPLRDQKQNVIGAIETLQDVTVRKQKEVQDERLRVIEFVGEVIQSISTVVQSDNLYRIVAQKLFEQLKCSSVHVFLIREGGDRRWLESAASEPKGWYDETNPKIFELDMGFAGWVFREKKSLLVRNTHDDERFQVRNSDHTPRSMLLVPFIEGDQIVGVISVDYDEINYFDEADQKLLDMLAVPIARTIEQVKSIEFLQEINKQIISERGFKESLYTVVKGAVELLNTSSGVVHLLDDTGSRVTHTACYPKDVFQPKPRLSQTSLTYKVFHKREPVIWAHAKKESDIHPKIKGQYASMIGVPLLREDKVVGVLFLNDIDEHAFSPREVALLQTLASLAAIDLENADLYEQGSRHTESLIAHMKAIISISKLTTLSELSEPKILDGIYTGISPLMDTDNMYIALYDLNILQADKYNTEQPEKSEIHGTVRFGLAMSDGNAVDIQAVDGWEPRQAGNGLTEYVIRTRCAFLPPDVALAYNTIADEYIGKTPKSWLGVPMLSEDRVLGVVVLRNEEKENVYDEENQEILQIIANQSAIAIQNARLRKRERQHSDQLQMLRDLSEDLSLGGIN